MTSGTPSPSRANWPLRSPAVLIAAQSGRALAAAARRAGYSPLVADLFGDDDTRTLASRTVRLPKRLSAPAFRHALDCLSDGAAPVGLVYGSLLESRPDLLDVAAAAHAILGNGADTVRRLKDPFAFAALCRDCAVPWTATSAAAGCRAAKCSLWW